MGRARMESLKGIVTVTKGVWGDLMNVQSNSLMSLRNYESINILYM